MLELLRDCQRWFARGDAGRQREPGRSTGRPESCYINSHPSPASKGLSMKFAARPRLTTSRPNPVDCASEGFSIDTHKSCSSSISSRPMANRQFGTSCIRTRSMLVTCFMTSLLFFSREFPLTMQVPLKESDENIISSDPFHTHFNQLYNSIAPELSLQASNGGDTIVYPRIHRSLRRNRRSSVKQTTVQTSSDGVESTIVTIRHSSGNSTFFLELKPYENILGSNFTTVLRSDDKVEHLDVNEILDKNKGCLYKGKILSHPGGKATISMCHSDGRMYGMMVTNNGTTYLLRPLPDSKLSRHRRESNQSSISDNSQDGLVPHILYDSVNVIGDDFCGAGDRVEPIVEAENIVFERRLRFKREDGDIGNKTIETAIFIDAPMYNDFDRKYDDHAVPELLKMIKAIIAEVQLIYEYKSMKISIKIVIVRLEIIKSQSAGPKMANGDIDKYLNEFCTWQMRRNREQATNRWDHALMLSGLDLYKATSSSSRKNSKVLGLAWVNGMCRPQYSCTLNEGKSFEAAFVIAHELGHSLGIQHDGSGNNCDPDKYIMSAKTGGGKINWSSCSNKYLEDFFKRGSGRCLSNGMTPAEDFDFAHDGTLPGESYPPSEQCKLALGSDFKPFTSPNSPFNDICHELWCVSGSWAKPAHPALEGSKCGSRGTCLQGECVRASITRRRDTESSGLSTSVRQRETNRSFVDDVKSFFRGIYARMREMTRNVFSGR